MIKSESSVAALDSAIGLTLQVTKGKQMLSRGMSRRYCKDFGWCSWALQVQRGWWMGGWRCTKPWLSCHRTTPGMFQRADMLILIHWGIIIDDHACCHIWESLVHAKMCPYSNTWWWGQRCHRVSCWLQFHVLSKKDQWNIGPYNTSQKTSRCTFSPYTCWMYNWIHPWGNTKIWSLKALFENDVALKPLMVITLVYIMDRKSTRNKCLRWRTGEIKRESKRQALKCQKDSI